METGMTKFGAVSILYPTLDLFRSFPMDDFNEPFKTFRWIFTFFFSNFFQSSRYNFQLGRWIFFQSLSLMPSKPFREMRHVQRPFVVFSCHAREFGSFLFLEESLFIWISYLHEDREVYSVSRPVRYHYRLSDW